METETARLVSYAIVAGGGLVWLSGLWFLIRTTNQRKAPIGKAEQSPRWMEEIPSGPVSGTCELEGQPAELAVKAASALARSSGAPFGIVKIIEQTHDRVTFERSQTLGSGLRKGRIYLQTAGHNRTRIAYSLEVSGKPILLWAGFLFQLVGLVVLAVGFWVLQTYVITHPDPTVRWQVLQGLQVTHFLWPPFLFGGIYLKTLRITRDHFDALIHNLSYQSD